MFLRLLSPPKVQYIAEFNRDKNLNTTDVPPISYVYVPGTYMYLVRINEEHKLHTHTMRPGFIEVCNMMRRHV